MKLDNIVKYIIISPVRDEEKYIELTMNSVINQTIKPLQWIIVDDGSKDNTYDIILKYTKKYNWIIPIKKYTTLKENLATGSEAKAFLHGTEFIAHNDYEFIVKLDGDLSFEKDYFEQIFQEFIKNPNLGIVSGGCHEYKKGRLVLEKVPNFHTRGASKVYKKDCFLDIGGIIPRLGWDTIDEIKALTNGWETRNFPKIKLIHHKKTGSRGSILQGKIREGRVAHFVGYNTFFMLLRCIRNIFKYPFLIGGIAMIIGYIQSWLNEDKIREKDIIHFIWKEQLKKSIGGSSKWK